MYALLERKFMSFKTRYSFKAGLIFIVLGITWFRAGAQYSDPLYDVWNDEQQSDSIRVQAYKDYIWNYYLFSNPDSAIILTDEMHAFAKERNYPLAASQADALLSIAYNIVGENAVSLAFAEKSLAANEALGNLWGVSECEIILGAIYFEEGDTPRALRHFKTALMIDERIGNKEGMAMSLNNIGNIYGGQNNVDSAMVYYERALVIDRELDVKQGIAVELINLGGLHRQKGNTLIAIQFYTEAQEVAEEVGDLDSKAGAISGLGRVYQERGEYALALEQFEESLMIYEKMGAKRGVAKAKETIGFHYLKTDEYQRATEFCQESLDLALEIGALDLESSACQCLYKAQKALGNTTKALGYHEQMLVARDSIFSRENSEKLMQIQMQYEFDKKEAETLAEQEKKDALAKKELERQKLVRNSFIGGFIVVLLFAGVFLSQRNRIGKEKERSEGLLLNILPAETAKELKEKGQADAQLIEQVTVLFTDFKGFTAMSEKLSPEALVKDLHACFSLFDRVCEKYGIEKIKTIGDAYMAAGGLPTPNHTHARDAVNAALEMAQIVEAGKAKKIASGEPFFEIRIGVNTGPVVAGIVGIKKFQYDIWGDTVNTASRMESSGEVGQVNISQTTYNLLKHDTHFAFNERGKIKAKGKGEIEMYFVSRA